MANTLVVIATGIDGHLVPIYVPAAPKLRPKASKLRIKIRASKVARSRRKR